MPNSVFLDIIVDKGPKVKVRKITFDGNKNLSRWKLNKAMKKTNEYNKIYNLFSSKKFVRDLYEADKKALIDKYNEVGFRDAFIEVDSVTPVKDKDNLVDVYIKINEGKKYYFRDISWVGNTLYSIDDLNRLLRIKKVRMCFSKHILTVLFCIRISSFFGCIDNFFQVIRTMNGRFCLNLYLFSWFRLSCNFLWLFT